MVSMVFPVTIVVILGEVCRLTFYYLDDKGIALAVMLTTYLLLLTAYVTICFLYQFQRRQNDLLKLAYCDPLTGAYNYSRFKKECEELLKNEHSYSIVTLDMEKFRMINVRFGKKKADQILCEISNILKQDIKENECYCREAADHFFLLLKEDVGNRVKEILRKIEMLSDLLDKEFYIQTRAGIIDCKKEKSVVIYDRAIDSVVFALKEAKKENKKILYYDDALKEKERIQNYIELYKEKALFRGEIQVFLQPKVDLKTGKIAGAEALVRWIKEDGDMIYPDQFIPIFEQNGFDVQLDLYVCDRIGKKIREWCDRGISPISISVNQSKRLFNRPDYIEQLSEILERYQIPSSSIILEMTEGTEIRDVEAINQVIEKLHEKGFRVSMDDFGSGYSSLNVLGSVMLDELKFDRMFLLGLRRENNLRQKAIMRSIVSFAKEMNMTVVVEGVETPEHEEFIKNLGCEYGQGYYYSKPIPINEFEEKYLVSK